MFSYSTSKRLIKNTKKNFKIRHYSFFLKFFSKQGTFYGWGRKKSGKKAKN